MGSCQVPKPKEKLLRVIDENDVVVTSQLNIGPAPRAKLPGDWIAVFERALLKLANLRLSTEQSAMVFFILAQSNRQLVFVCDTSYCFACTGIHPKHQSRVLNALLDKGILVLKGKIGIKRAFILNACLGWKSWAGDYPSGTQLWKQDEVLKSGLLVDHHTGELLTQRELFERYATASSEINLKPADH